MTGYKHPLNCLHCIISRSKTGASNHRYGKPAHPNLIKAQNRVREERWGDGVERFWSKVDKTPGFGPNGDCWRWTGYMTPYGYGQATVKGYKTTAHRISWELANGRSMQKGLHACHSCDVPSCVNPAHIWEGTAGENMRDAVSKGLPVGRRRTQ